MNYQKLDASLAAALDEAADPDAHAFSVFIHTHAPPGPEEVATLERLGAGRVEADRAIHTATLSTRALAALSELPFVKYLRLAHRLRLMPGDDTPDTHP